MRATDEPALRIHKTLKVTPAMAAGVTSKLREMSDMVAVLEAWEATQKAQWRGSIVANTPGRSRVVIPAFLTLGGIGAAFGLAACCALPVLLLSLGFGSAWLVGVGFYAGMHRPEFLAVAFAGLIGGTLTLITYRRRIGIVARSAMSIGLLAGAVMLYYGYVYA